MKLLSTLSLKLKIQLVVGLFLIFLFATAGIVVYNSSLNRLEQSVHKQSAVYLENIAAIVAEVEKNSTKGFDSNDYIALKPYFNKPAFHTTDYPYIIDSRGLYNIHLFKEGQLFSKDLLNQIYSSHKQAGVIEHTEIINNKPQQILTFYRKLDSANAVLGISVNFDEATTELNNTRLQILLLVIFGSLIIMLLISLTLKPSLKGIAKVNRSVSLLAQGDIPDKISSLTNDEVGNIIQSLNHLIDGLKRTAAFANDMKQNNLSSEFTALGTNDRLGNALLSMRASLIKANEDEKKRKIEDNQRNWVNSGLAKFADILRQNNNTLHQLADNVTQHLLNYLDATQGGLFIINDNDEDNPFLELISAFAYNRKKFKQKSIMLGEGLVGNCVIEKHTIHLKEIPENYIEITSGLGEATPRSLLIVPLKIEEKVFGVIEIASFNEFKKHEIEFIEKIGESIASTLSAVQNSIRTTQLLEQSQQQREEMAAQEEEMRQNMEEMQATQEEMSRKTIEMEGMTSAINQAMLFAELTSDGFFSDLNSNFLTLLDYSMGEIEDKRIHTLIHNDDANEFSNAWRQVNSGETYKGTLRWINRKSEELFILCSITPAYDETGELYKIFFLGQDVTASKLIEIKAKEQAEEIERNLGELQVKQELAKRNQDNIDALLKALDTTCLITEMDESGRITFINNRNVEVLADSKEMIEGKLHSELDYDAKHNPEKYKQFWSQLLNGIAQQREFSLKVKNKLVWISEHYTPIFNDKGDISKIINIGIDISEGKNTEIMLQQQVEELTKQLRKK